MDQLRSKVAKPNMPSDLTR